MKNETSIKQMFNNIAKNYDRLNNIISLGRHSIVKKNAINNVPLKSDFKVLDICTGTGDIVIYIAKNITKGGSVIGIDFSENMLEIAKQKAINIQNIDFLIADALALPFKDGEFDACFISFGLRNIPDYKKCLAEMKRVTKKGGFIINMDTGKPKNIFRPLYNFYFFNIVPLFGKIFNGNSQPYKYLPESTIKFPSGDELVHTLEEIGLNNVKKFDFLFGAISQQIGQV